MSSDTPDPAPEQVEKVIHKVNTTSQNFPPPPTPKRIEAESQSRNSYLKLCIVAGLAVGLIIALVLDVIFNFVIFLNTAADSARQYNGYSREILLVVSTGLAYLLGSYKGGEQKEER
jgi:hypothetical protein